MKRALIVDDAIDLGRLFQDALKTAYPGIPITVVPSAEEALLESTRYSYDLLVTDLRLPGMSGLELIRKIRVRQPHIKVILVSALALDDPLMRLKDEVNPDVFLRKPVTITNFLESVTGLMTGGTTSTPPRPSVIQRAQALAEEAKLSGAGERSVTPLHRMTGRLSPPPQEPQPAPPEGGLAGVLSRLRGSLGALSAFLLDERGHPVAQAGDLPGVTLAELVPPMLTALSAGAKVSYLLGQADTRSIQAYRGTELDLILAPVGQFTLLLAMRTGRSMLRLALAFEEALSAQDELYAVLEAMGLHVQSAAEVGAPEAMLAEMGVPTAPEPAAIPPELLETPLGQDPDLEKFEDLFAQKKTGQLHLQDPDAFWDVVASGDGPDVSPSSGVLSFDQAQKLGLVPPDKES